MSMAKIHESTQLSPSEMSIITEMKFNAHCVLIGTSIYELGKNN